MATPAKKKSLSLHFNVDDETKGTYKFKEPEQGGVRPAVGTLYITKSRLAELDPAWLQKGVDVTITVSG